MSFQTFTFYAFSAILIFAALRVITTRNPVHAALWLVLSFFSAAGIWLLLQAEFLAIALVLVYVGALVLFEMALVIVDSAIGHAATAGSPPTGSNTVALGKLLYVDYVYPFEIAAVVLLVAIIAAIALTQRGEPRHRKHQDPSWQVKVRREDRVRLVDLPSEKPPA